MIKGGERDPEKIKGEVRKLIMSYPFTASII